MHYIYLFEIIFIHLFDIFSLLILLFQIQYCQLQHKLIDVRLFQYLSFLYFAAEGHTLSTSLFRLLIFLLSIYFLFILLLSIDIEPLTPSLFIYLFNLSSPFLFSSHSHLISNIPLTVMLNFCRKLPFCVNRRQNLYLIT